uniref:Uncharacterized protein n=1 Tax=Steinernema glaseri TaxID=37863 RepID=A0A1I7XXY8_9BILA
MVAPEMSKTCKSGSTELIDGQLRKKDQLRIGNYQLRIGNCEKPEGQKKTAAKANKSPSKESTLLTRLVPFKRATKAPSKTWFHEKPVVNVCNLALPIRVYSTQRITRDPNGGLLFKEEVAFVGAGNDWKGDRLPAIKLEPDVVEQMNKLSLTNSPYRNDNEHSAYLGDSLIAISQSTRILQRFSHSGSSKTSTELIRYSSDRQDMRNKERGVVASAPHHPGLQGPLNIEVHREVTEGKRGAYSVKSTITVTVSDGSFDSAGTEVPLVWSRRSGTPEAENPISFDEKISYGSTIFKAVRQIEVAPLKAIPRPGAHSAVCSMVDRRGYSTGIEEVITQSSRSDLLKKNPEGQSDSIVSSAEQPNALPSSTRCDIRVVASNSELREPAILNFCASNVTVEEVSVNGNVVWKKNNGSFH